MYLFMYWEPVKVKVDNAMAQSQTRDLSITRLKR